MTAKKNSYQRAILSLYYYHKDSGNLSNGMLDIQIGIRRNIRNEMRFGRIREYQSNNTKQGGIQFFIYVFYVVVQVTVFLSPVTTQ